MCDGRGYRFMPVVLTEQCTFCHGEGLYTPARRPWASEACPHCDAFGMKEPARPPSEGEEGLLVFQLKAGKPYSATMQIEKLFESLSGDVCICDPFYGTKTLARLNGLLHCDCIRFLTCHPDSKEAKTCVLPANVVDYQKEHPKIEFRLHVGNDIHDRYVLADETLIIMGHGLKDPGNKDSFIVQLPKDVVPDLFEHLLKTFDTRWSQAQPLR